MSSYSILWHEISTDVCKKLNVSDTSFSHEAYRDQIEVRNARANAYLILILELILQEHRDKYSVPSVSLSGAAALHHKIFLKTKWLPQTIRDLSYEDCLFVLLEDLHPENLSTESQNYLKILEIQKSAFVLNKPLLEGWTPEKYGHHTSRLYQDNQ
ncbi:ECs1072 family phage-associated protein [Yersinia mollaretii]|uniref:ECs1072 family phage-associated protein n=1 Tax=Yersinia mollaretii TaxID=33060 RepID=UPI0021FD9251|nr:hypothetical protein FORC065_3442 [Yersinia enterocolitica]HEN3296566.1 hypothetical protein [Yersinia enterocolitica]